MWKHLAAWTIVLLAMAGIAGGLGFYKYTALMAGQAAAQMMPEPVQAVAATRARSGEWAPETRAIGTVVALREIEIRNEIAGVIERLGFRSGETVEAGQLLVQFDTRQEQASLAAAEAEANLARLTLERRRNLRGSPAFSPQEFDKAQSEFAAASARAQNLQVAIEKKRIVAPFTGRAGITNLQPGAYLDVGARITTLQGTGPDAYVDFSLPQDSAVVIRPGSTVLLSGAVLPSGPVAAAIAAEDNSVDRASRSVRFRAIASGLGAVLRPGMFVDVTAGTAKPQPMVFVPLAAVRRSPHGQHVFVLAREGGKLRARQRPVETGPVQGGEVAVSKGLAAGELVAAAGSFKLHDGVLVQTDLAPTEGHPAAGAPLSANNN